MNPRSPAGGLEVRPLSALREARLEAQLLELACSNPATACELIRLLAETNRDLLRAMHEALREGRWHALAAEAHRLLGAARLIGWRTLCRLTERVERAARSADHAAASVALANLDRVLTRLDASLARLLDRRKKSPT